MIRRLQFRGAAATALPSARGSIARRHNSASPGGGAAAGAAKAPPEFVMPEFKPRAAPDFPIVQLPAESLWCRQPPLSLAALRTPEIGRMIQRLHESRRYYQYPSLGAPQIGWNVSVFALYDGSTWVNPVTRPAPATLADGSDGAETCWTWEPSASCCFLMHYIERPHAVVAERYDETGKFHAAETLTGMRSRLVQHQMDHMNGVIFTRRIPNSLHVVPMDGFHTMSDWAEDFPSIEARSTNLYTLFFAPHRFVPHFLEDSELMKRHYEDNVFPGYESVTHAVDEEERNHAALSEFIEYQKRAGLWNGSQFSHSRKKRGAAATVASPAPAQSAS
jgi:peptide deformylase